MESVPAPSCSRSAFSAGGEPEESSAQFAFLDLVGCVDNKTKYYKQFQEHQNW